MGLEPINTLTKTEDRNLEISSHRHTESNFIALSTFNDREQIKQILKWSEHMV